MPARKRDVAARLPGPRFVQPLLDHQSGNDQVGKRLGHLLESGGIVERRVVGVLQQRLAAVVADRHACITGFNDVAIAAQRFRARGQAASGNASGKANADKGLHARYFRTKPPCGVIYGHCFHDSAQAPLRHQAGRA